SCNIPCSTSKYALLMEQQTRKYLYIVVDTNVFLSNINAIDLARETTFKSYDHSIIVVPWTVIRELDYIKDDNGKSKSTTLCVKARKAINYIHKLFSSKEPYIIGQTSEDVARNKVKFSVDCPDDEILQTCLQIRDLGKSVVLLSYDMNLCNKAMIYDIVTLGRNDPLEKIDYLNATTFINESISHFNNDTTSILISKEMYTLYGESWEKYVVIRPPWTTVTVLKCAVKHWIAAIKCRAQKAFQYFEMAYVYARDMCGMAAEVVGMPCSFQYNIPNPLPPIDYVKQIQPELAANVNKLLCSLSAVTEQVKSSCIDYRSLTNLHQTLITFLPESAPAAMKLIDIDLVPLDIYCCIKRKEDILTRGLRQLQELSTHFCRLASYKCT
ncbi:Transcriptional protein SWT1, partial [Eufriesea mexicana]